MGKGKQSMKKIKIAGICLIVLILAAFVSVPVYNNYCAYNVEKMLSISTIM